MNTVKKIIYKFQYNSPVTLTFALISLGVLILANVTNNKSTELLFCVYKSSFKDPLAYLRLFLHVFGHSDFNHYSGNFLIMLIVGPRLEEYYGAKKIILMIFITAISTGIIFILFSQPNAYLLGASGVVFMMILLSSFANTQKGRIPLTLIVVLCTYLGKEFIEEIRRVMGTNDGNISYITHIVGGVCGAIAGFLIPSKKNQTD